MAGSTPIYGFPYPQPSDLVANYPALGQELAEDIEAVLPTLGGLVSLASATPSAASSTIFDNVFSSTYRQYLVAWVLVGSATADLAARFRSGSPPADDTSSNYHRQLIQVNNATFAGERTTSTSCKISQIRTNAIGNMFVINNPNSALVTTTSSMAQADFAGGTVSDVQYRADVNALNTTTQYTGITLFPSTGTYTGRINIFGVKL
jgi:hypothetical protein